MATIKFRRGTSASWAARDPVLGAGEPGQETDTGFLKIGDGVKRWTQLDYFLPRPSLVVTPTDVGGITAEDVLGELMLHINSQTPHPIYDDGPSLLLLYENAKA